MKPVRQGSRSHGGFDRINDAFNLADQWPNGVEELQALMTNPSLADQTFKNCFEPKGPFARLTEEVIQGVLY
jgi:hypothetical protein